MTDAPEVEDRRGFLGRHGGKLVLSLLVGGVFAWVLKAGKMPLTPPRESFDNVSWWMVAIYCALWSFVHFIRAIRWHWLLAPVTKAKLRAIIAVSWIGFAAIVLLPLRAGEAVRPLMMRKRSAISGWAATGTIAAERIIDGLFLSLMLLAGLSLTTQLSPLPDHIGSLPISSKIVPRAAYGALVVFALAFVVMGVFYWRRTWARKMTERVIGAVSPKLATWLADRVEHVADGLRFLTDMRYTAPFVALTAVYWLLNSAGTMLIARGAGFADFSYGQACVATGVVALGLLVPNAPGFFGAYQLSFYAALAVFYPGDQVVGQGAALVFIVYTIQLLITVAGAGIGALIDPGVTQTLGPDTAENLPRSPSEA